MTYTVTVHFQDRRPAGPVKYDRHCPACRRGVAHREWIKGGYTLAAALNVKDAFLVGVPTAVFGSVEPERRKS